MSRGTCFTGNSNCRCDMGTHIIELFYLYICGNIPVVMAGGVIWDPIQWNYFIYISVVIYL